MTDRQAKLLAQVPPPDRASVLAIAAQLRTGQGYSETVALEAAIRRYRLAGPT